MDFGRARADVIGDRQRSAPCLWSYWSLQCLEQRNSVSIGDRKDRYLHYDIGVFPVDSPRPFYSAPAWRQGVARVDRHVHHRASLHALLWPVRPLRIHITLEVTVVPGVR